MVHILINEILYHDQEELLYKTVDEAKRLYGVHSSRRGRIIAPTFLHIFPFKGSDTRTVAVDEKEQYLGLDYNGLLIEIDEETKDDYRSTIIKNSRCNCWHQNNTNNCGLCDSRKQIRNKAAIRLLDLYMGWAK